MTTFSERLNAALITTDELREYLKELPDKGNAVISAVELQALIEEVIHYREKKSTQ